MKINNLHNWNVSAKEAIRIQRLLQRRIVLNPPIPPLKKGGEGGILKIKSIAGADMAIDEERGVGFAGVIVYSFTKKGTVPFLEGGLSPFFLEEIERQSAVVPIKFPYIPGLLAFREAPVLLEAFRKIKKSPDIIMFDGQGIAHPRGLGIASHMGLFLDKPTIGCAKSRLVGEYKEPGGNIGDWSPLTLARVFPKSLPLCKGELEGVDNVSRSTLPNPPLQREGKIIGAVLRTRKNVKPVFVSPGHLIDLATSIEITLACLDRTRIPKPTREADHFVSELKKSYNKRFT